MFVPNAGGNALHLRSGPRISLFYHLRFFAFICGQTCLPDIPFDSRAHAYLTVNRRAPINWPSSVITATRQRPDGSSPSASLWLQAR